MQYDVDTPRQYIAALDDDWRLMTLQALRAIIADVAPELEEGIQYKMLSYSKGDDSVFHLNAQKNYVSFYVGNTEKVDPSGALLDGLDVGKGCIRFKKSVAVESSRIEEFIRLAAERWRNGADIGC